VKLYQAKDLIDMGLFGSKPSLDRRIKSGDFPLGKLTSPNRRTWTDEQVATYYDSCPTEKKTASPPKAVDLDKAADLDMRRGRKTTARKDKHDGQNEVEPVGGDRQAH
jgi:hypothetical protein